LCWYKRDTDRSLVRTPVASGLRRCTLETAKLNAMDPEAYLRELLRRVAEYPINR
jgi:hypothetical protein